MKFSHEKLKAYQRAIDFVAWTNTIYDVVPSGISSRGQLERASTSIPLNLAEGNAKFSPKDRCRFFQIAVGSALECAACLDVMVARRVLDGKIADEGKQYLFEIVNLGIGLINSFAGKIAEEAPSYSDSIAEQD